MDPAGNWQLLFFSQERPAIPERRSHPPSVRGGNCFNRTSFEHTIPTAFKFRCGQRLASTADESARASGAVRINMQSKSHVVVIGAGAFGGWTALYLLRRGARVTL